MALILGGCVTTGAPERIAKDNLFISSDYPAINIELPKENYLVHHEADKSPYGHYESFLYMNPQNNIFTLINTSYVNSFNYLGKTNIPPSPQGYQSGQYYSFGDLSFIGRPLKSTKYFLGVASGIDKNIPKEFKPEDLPPDIIFLAIRSYGSGVDRVFDAITICFGKALSAPTRREDIESSQWQLLIKDTLEAITINGDRINFDHTQVIPKELFYSRWEDDGYFRNDNPNVEKLDWTPFYSPKGVFQ